MPFQHGGRAQGNPERDQQPGLRVNRPASRCQHRKDGQDDDQPRAQPSRPSRPEPRRQRQQHPEPKKQHQVDERDQPDEVPRLQVESLRRVEGAIYDSDGDVELARGKTAPRREDQHVDRAKSSHGFARPRPVWRAEAFHRASSRGLRPQSQTDSTILSQTGFGQYRLVTALIAGSYEITKLAWRHAHHLRRRRAARLAGRFAGGRSPPPGTQFHMYLWHHPSIRIASRPAALRSCATGPDPLSRRPIRSRARVSPGEPVTPAARPRPGRNRRRDLESSHQGGW